MLGGPLERSSFPPLSGGFTPPPCGLSLLRRSQRRVLSPARLTYLKLLQAVTRPELQIDEVDAVIRADVGMTHRLLKYLGSAALGFRTEITSVRHGLALLGREQTRRFVSLVALGEMGSEKPPELLVASAVRGRFCELIGDDVALADQKAELFLMGLLSLVDAMLDQPMTKFLEQLSLSRDLTNALIGEKSQLRPVLEFVEHYERAERNGRPHLGWLRHTASLRPRCAITTTRRLHGPRRRSKADCHGDLPIGDDARPYQTELVHSRSCGWPEATARPFFSRARKSDGHSCRLKNRRWLVSR